MFVKLVKGNVPFKVKRFGKVWHIPADEIPKEIYKEHKDILEKCEKPIPSIIRVKSQKEQIRDAKIAKRKAEKEAKENGE